MSKLELGKIAEIAEELDEADLYDTGPAQNEEASDSAGSDQDEEVDVFSTPKSPSALLTDSAGQHSGSAKSTTFVDVDGAGHEEGRAGLGHPLPGLQEREPRQRGPSLAVPSKRAYTSSMAQSMPVKMGSSVPINIPFLGPGRQGGPSQPQDMQPATFVPPHELSMMSQRDGYLSVLGDSPSSAFRRDRLRVRNAILKSTGFLEQGSTSLAPAPTAPPNMLGSMPMPMPAASGSAMRAGGLSQALQLAGSPATAAIF